MSNLDFLTMVIREAGFRSHPVWGNGGRFLGMYVSYNNYTKVLSDITIGSSLHGLEGIQKMKEIMKGLHIERKHEYPGKDVLIYWETVPCGEMQEA